MLTETKYFTPTEARKTLPLVRQIVDDILKDGREIKLIAESHPGNVHELPEVQVLLKKIQGYIAELEEIGCFYKDWNFEYGLVDFPSIINDQEVFLCWRTDEETILYYHTMEEGYQGRELIPPEYIEG